MAYQRKTAAEKRVEQERTRHQAWERFCSDFEQLSTIADVETLLSRPPSTSDPRRPYFSNFGFFWNHAFMIPASASGTELRMYASLVRKLEATGVMKPGAADEVVVKLQDAAKEKGF